MTKPITEEELAQWRAEEGTATEGPWSYTETDIYAERTGQLCDGWGCVIPDIDDSEWGAPQPDFEHCDGILIATMRNNFGRLLDEVERLQKLVSSSRCECGEPMTRLSASCCECWYGGDDPEPEH